MFTALGVLSVRVSEGCTGGNIPESSKKNMLRLTLILDVLFGLGVMLCVYFINKGRGTIPLSVAAQAIIYSGFAECVLPIILGFVLISKNKI